MIGNNVAGMAVVADERDLLCDMEMPMIEIRSVARLLRTAAESKLPLDGNALMLIADVLDERHERLKSIWLEATGFDQGGPAAS